MLKSSIGVQKIARAYLAQKHYKILHKQVMQERRERQAATTIQCMFRTIVARHVYAHVKSIERRPSQQPPMLSGKALKAALKADKAAAIAVQTATNRKQEVDALTTQLGTAAHTVEKAKALEVELASVHAELAAALAELEFVKTELAGASERAARLEKENAELKLELESGVLVSGEPYTSKMYADYPDLEGIDKGLYLLKAQSKKGKEDLKTLLSSISFLK